RDWSSDVCSSDLGGLQQPRDKGVARRLGGRQGVLAHDRSTRNVRSAFWACKRFSASTKTTDCGPSSTSAVISLPRYAGKQCSTIASGAAAASVCASRRNGPKSASASSVEVESPIETHVSVARTRAPLTASVTESVTSTEPPV